MCILRKNVFSIVILHNFLFLLFISTDLRKSSRNRVFHLVIFLISYEKSNFFFALKSLSLKQKKIVFGNTWFWKQIIIHFHRSLTIDKIEAYGNVGRFPKYISKIYLLNPRYIRNIAIILFFFIQNLIFCFVYVCLLKEFL